MELPYYQGKTLLSVNVYESCPGCKQMEQLSMRSKVNSYCHERIEYFVGCNCGWLGPTACNPMLAAEKWDIRK